MKKLLKILAVIGLTTPLSVNVVACGNNSSADTDNNEVSENPNVQNY